MEERARTMTYFTHHLPLMTIEEVRKELTKQGVDSMVYHVEWSQYVVFSVGYQDGAVLEIYKTNSTYMMRSHGGNWNFPPQHEVLEVIRRELEDVCR